MKPELHILGLSIKTFGIFFALNFVAWGAVLARRLRELGKPVDWAYEVVFVALAGGLVGARGYYVAQHWSQAKHDLVGTIFSGSGLVWYGGLLGGAVAVLLWAKRRNFLSLELLDMTSYGLALGYAIGRIGCQVSGDGDYGKAVGRAVGDGLPARRGTDHADRPSDSDLRDARDGPRGAVPVAAARPGAPGRPLRALPRPRGLERFLVEFIRRNAEVWAGLTAAQLESLGLLAAGVVWLAVLARRGGFALSATPRAPRPASA